MPVYIIFLDNGDNLVTTMVTRVPVGANNFDLLVDLLKNFACLEVATTASQAP